MKTFAQWVLALTRGYIKATGKEPDKLAKLKINMEAGQKVKDQKKVIEFPKERVTDWTKERSKPGMFDNIFAKMQKDMGKKPKVVKTQSLFATEKEFASDLQSIRMNLIKNDPHFNLKIAERYKLPGERTYSAFEEGKLLSPTQRQKILDDIKGVMKNDEYRTQFGEDFNFTEITDDLFRIDKAYGGLAGMLGERTGLFGGGPPGVHGRETGGGYSDRERHEQRQNVGGPPGGGDPGMTYQPPTKFITKKKYPPSLSSPTLREEVRKKREEAAFEAMWRGAPPSMGEREKMFRKYRTAKLLEEKRISDFDKKIAERKKLYPYADMTEEEFADKYSKVYDYMKQDPNWNFEEFQKVSFANPGETFQATGARDIGLPLGRTDTREIDLFMTPFGKTNLEMTTAGPKYGYKKIMSDQDKAQVALHEMRHKKILTEPLLTEAQPPLAVEVSKMKGPIGFRPQGEPPLMYRHLAPPGSKNEFSHPLDMHEVFTRFMDSQYGHLKTPSGPYFDKIWRDEWQPYADKYEKILTEYDLSPVNLAGGGIAGMLGEPTYQDDSHRVPLRKGKTPKYKKDPIDWWELLGPDDEDPDVWSDILKSVGLREGGRVPLAGGKKALQGLAKLMDEFFPGTTKVGQTSRPMAEKTQLKRALADFQERQKAAKLKEEQIKEFKGEELLKWDDLGGSKADPFSPDFDFKAEADLIAKTPFTKSQSKKLKVWENPDKVRAAVDDIFSSGDYKMDAQMASEALVENNPKAFGNKLFDDLDDKTRSDIYGAVVNVVQRDLAKMLQLKRAPKPTKTLEGIKKTGTIDISDPNIAEEFTKFMKETDPKGHAKVQKVVDDANQQLELKRFKTKGRKPNADGGRVPMWLGGGLGVGKDLLRAIMKYHSKTGTTGLTGSKMLQLVNPKQFNKMLDKPEGIPAIAKEIIEKHIKEMKADRLGAVEHSLGMAKKMKKSKDKLKEVDKITEKLTKEFVDKGMDKEMVKDLVDMFINAKYPDVLKIKALPNITDKAILELENIGKNLATKGRKLNASGGLAHMVGE